METRNTFILCSTTTTTTNSSIRKYLYQAAIKKARNDFWFDQTKGERDEERVGK